MDPIPGWYVDAMEQNLGQLVAIQAHREMTVDELVEMFKNPEVRGDGTALSKDEHVVTLAICVAILLRRLARVDMPA